MNKILVYLKIVRPLNIFLSATSVIISAWLINSIYSPLLPYTIIIVISFVGASNILNDIVDVKIDKVNQPDRILASDRLKMKSAIVFTISLFLIGINFCQFIHPLGKYIAIFIVLPLSIIYTPILKKIPFIGNIVIGLILGSVFIFSESAIIGEISQMWIPFYLATILSIIRELIKDAADINGDSINNISTFPNKFGLKSTLLLIRLLISILFIISLMPWFNNIYNNYYIFLLIIGVLFPSFYVVFLKLNKKSTFTDYIQAAKLFKIITFCGMMVIFSTGIN
tara:strand:- start:33 stop:878 length:846 start_codon:yes stop_codon:yes gene_type:complete